MKTIYLLLCSLITIPAFGQEKEVLLIGTMHTVPNIVKNSYRPLLKFAEKYDPDAIYVETIRPDDSLSLAIHAKKFIATSDSVAEFFVKNEERFALLNETPLSQFTVGDFELMARTYLVQKDQANYSYYRYLATYGVEGSEEPLRHEDTDLTARLAIALDMKYIFSMDDQQGYVEYHEAWEKCVEAGAKNGDNKINNQISRKIYVSSIVPALLGRLGQNTNRMKSLRRYHLVNSFRYVQTPTCDCEDGTTYWDERNARMAANIAEQVMLQSHEKNIVIVGAGHLVGIAEALQQNHPELSIRMMYDGRK